MDVDSAVNWPYIRPEERKFGQIIFDHNRPIFGSSSILLLLREKEIKDENKDITRTRKTPQKCSPKKTPQQERNFLLLLATATASVVLRQK